MPDILFYSTNDDFKSDIQDQIKHHAQEYNFIEEGSDSFPDIVIVDEAPEKAAELQQKYANAPLFWLTTNADALPEGNTPHHLITKPTFFR